MSKNQNSRILLPNGCSCSQLSVIPNNWKQAKKITSPWRISYRFYDPTQPAPKQVSIKLMNRFKNVADRKQAVEQLIEDEIQVLKGGYNPFFKKVVSTRQAKYDIDSSSLFIPALYMVLDRLKLEPAYYKHIKNYIIPNIKKAAIHLGYNLMLISEVKRKHIIYMLDHLQEVNKRFSENTHNRFRTDLKILFRELVLIDAIETNVVNDIPVKQLEEKEKIVLSTPERKFINQYLLNNYPSFHRYLQIFFHSGARSSELLRLKGSDIDLKNQRYKVTVRKGKKHRTAWRVIKNIALSYWSEQMKGCLPDDYVFSKGLLPGEKPIQPYQIHKRWTRLIKSKEFEIEGKKTKITATFYSLKHSNSTEVVDHLNEQAAAELNGQTSEAMVVKIYDTKQKQRRADKLKKVNNPFA